MSVFKSQTPRPTPKFFQDRRTFSTKKERCTPRDNPPPRPPGKSCPPVSRVFSYRPSTRAQVVSFKESDSSLQSKCYDESSRLPYFDQCFEVVCKLGSGSFADVFKARSKDDGQYYAIKRSKEKFKGKFDRERKLEEVQKHEQLPKHENCIQFYKAWEEKQCLYIQTELCKISLSQYTEENHSIPEYIIWDYLVDLLLALKHLHDHNLVHLDIKPDNIFISEEGVCKLGDFGLVLDLSKGDLSEAIEGDPRYLAAELMEGKFSKAADVFSLGITILELACDLDLPTGGPLWHQLREGSFPQRLISGLSPELAQVIRLMMEPDPNKRLTVDQILRMEAISQILNQRKRSLHVKTLLSYFVLLFKGFLCCLCYLKTILMHPYNKFMMKEELITPARTVKSHPPEWDFSYSDDDVFDDEELNLLATSLSDTSGDSGNNSFNKFGQPSIPGRRACSTPAAMCYFPHKSILEPSGSPTFEWKRDSPYMSSSPKSRLRSPHSSVRRDGLKTIYSPHIEPKNLMEIFNADSDDEL